MARAPMQQSRIGWLLVGVAAATFTAAVVWRLSRGPAEPMPAPVAAAPTPADTREPPAPRLSVPTRERNEDWRARIASADRWTLPAGNRLPGVHDALLTGDIDAWIASLPPDRQQAAREFVARNALAYQIENKAQQAWMLDRGFPALEEFAAFDFDAHTADCDALRCSNAKVAALAADHLLTRVEALLPPGTSAALETPDIASQLTPEQLRELGLAMSSARDYLARASANGSHLFHAHLQARLAGLMGDVEGAELGYAYAAACGDSRAASLGHGQLRAALTFAMLSNAHQPCGDLFGSHPFPPGD